MVRVITAILAVQLLQGGLSAQFQLNSRLPDAVKDAVAIKALEDLRARASAGQTHAISVSASGEATAQTDEADAAVASTQDTDDDESGESPAQNETVAGADKEEDAAGEAPEVEKASENQDSKQQNDDDEDDSEADELLEQEPDDDEDEEDEEDNVEDGDEDGDEAALEEHEADLESAKCEKQHKDKLCSADCGALFKQTSNQGCKALREGGQATGKFVNQPLPHRHECANWLLGQPACGPKKYPGLCKEATWLFLFHSFERAHVAGKFTQKWARRARASAKKSAEAALPACSGTWLN